MLIQCCVCKRIRRDEIWVDSHWVDLTRENHMSHGYCPACAEAAYSNFRRIWTIADREPERAASS